MEFNEYQKKAVSTKLYSDKYKIIYPALSLGDESGEVMGKIKKWLRGDAGVGEMDKERIEAIKLEMGDVLWCLSALADDLGLNLSDIAQANIDKIMSRKERGVIMGDGDNR
jgi:NTP pyrophosphatase (non-canonical NTP hydrolase)